MSTFAIVAAELVAGVLNTHPNTTTFIKAAMVRQLGNLQPEVVPFMEKSGSFSTVANTASYSTVATGMPKSLLRFERLWYDMGAYPTFLNVVDMGTIRYLQEAASVAYPRRVSWYEEQLQFGPAPAGVYLVKWDITLDSQKDTATGALLTTASTTQTNAWFTTGVIPFKHLVWADYYATSPDQRADMAQTHLSAANVALQRLREAGRKREEMNAVAITPSAFDNYRPDASLRISTLFPGAPV